MATFTLPDSSTSRAILSRRSSGTSGRLLDDFLCVFPQTNPFSLIFYHCKQIREARASAEAGVSIAGLPPREAVWGVLPGQPGSRARNS